jgi:hypothetical protein
MLIVAGFGVAATLRDARRRRIGWILISSALAGFVLSLGDQGVLGWGYRFLFDHFPGFQVLREPQKAIALLVLGYAYFFAVGIQKLVSTSASRRMSVAMMAVGLVLPVAYNPSLFWGMRGRITVTHYPKSFTEANALMGGGEGRILFVPWHLYMAYPFTSARTVVNFATDAFTRTAIIGDDPELRSVAPPNLVRSRYLRFLFSSGPQIHSFGQLVAPLGVSYVVVGKTADWEAYWWLDQQRDLERVLDRPEIRVYRNLAAEPTGTRATERLDLPDWGALVAVSNERSLAGVAVFVDHLTGGPIQAPPISLEQPQSVALDRRSPVRYHAPSSPGKSAILPELYDPAWHSSQGSAELGAAGEAVVPVAPDRSAQIAFRFWWKLLGGYVLSGLAVLGAIASLWVGKRRNRGGRIREDPSCGT